MSVSSRVSRSFFFFFSLNLFINLSRSPKQAGTGSAGSLEAGVARVGRDAPAVSSERGGSWLEDIAALDAVGDDDDFFSVSFAFRCCSGVLLWSPVFFTTMILFRKYVPVI